MAARLLILPEGLMAQRIITEAEWKEIEQAILARPGRAHIDEGGAIWITREDGTTFGCMHPLAFLDVCRELEQE
jgi:hypothetical protein